MARTTYWFMLLAVYSNFRTSSGRTQGSASLVDLQMRREELAVEVESRGEAVAKAHTELRQPHVDRDCGQDHNTVVRACGQDAHGRQESDESQGTVTRSPEKELAASNRDNAAIIREKDTSGIGHSAGGTQEKDNTGVAQGVVRWHTPVAPTKAEVAVAESLSRWQLNSRSIGNAEPASPRSSGTFEFGHGLIVGAIYGVLRLIGDTDCLGILRTSVEVDDACSMSFAITFTVGTLLGLLRSFAMTFVVGVWFIVFGGLGLDIFRDGDVGDYVNGVSLLLCAFKFSVCGSRFPPPPMEKAKLMNDALCSGQPLPEKDTSVIAPSTHGNGGSPALDANAALSSIDLVGAVCLARVGLYGIPGFLACFILVSALGNAALGACWNALSPLTDTVTLDRMAGRLSCSLATALGVMWILLRPHDIAPSFVSW